MDRGAWQATVHGVTRVEHNLATKPQSPPKHLQWRESGKLMKCESLVVVRSLGKVYIIEYKIVDENIQCYKKYSFIVHIVWISYYNYYI